MLALKITTICGDISLAICFSRWLSFELIAEVMEDADFENYLLAAVCRVR